jgi:hypothetical protein
MTIAVSLRAPGQALCKISEVMAATWPDSLTRRRRTVAQTAASCRERPPRARPPLTRAHRP